MYSLTPLPRWLSARMLSAAARARSRMVLRVGVLSLIVVMPMELVV